MAPLQQIETLAIGDELLTGRVSDTNSTFVAAKLLAHGWPLSRTTVISDRIPETIDAINEVSKRADAAIVFGGLGPTSDDKTTEAVVQMIGDGYLEDEAAKKHLENFYAEKGRAVTKTALKQVTYPKGTEPLANPLGMAVPFYWKKGKCHLFFLPGVPREMKNVFGERVLPRLLRVLTAESGINYRQWRCLGIWESQLQEILDPIERLLPEGAAIGYRTTFPENHVSLYWPRKHPANDFESVVEKLSTTLRKWAYTDTEKDLETLVLEILDQRRLTLALAESCTGGETAARLTRIPKASKNFFGCFVPYQAGAKGKMLSLNLKKESDAVSQSCTHDLVLAARERSGADLVGAVTGYLGPTGGTAEDPIGTIYVAVLNKEKWLESRISLSEKERPLMQWAASTYLLHTLWRSLVES